MKKGDIVWTPVNVSMSEWWNGPNFEPHPGLYMYNVTTTSGTSKPVLFVNEKIYTCQFPIFESEAETIAYIAENRLNEYIKVKPIPPIPPIDTKYSKRRVKTEYYGTVKIDCNATEGNAK